MNSSLRFFDRFRSCFALVILLGLSGCQSISALISPPAQPSMLTAADLAIVANQADPLSMQIAQYYQQRRGIPAQNLIVISFPTNRTTLSPEEFQKLKAEVDAKTPDQVQAYALTWVTPYRVGCMSVTSAFAFGFDEQFCATGCKPTQASLYFNYNGLRPYQYLKIRPTMAIAATSFEQATALIDRGVASDGTVPTGTAYLMNTSDKFRNVRAANYPAITQALSSQFEISVVKGDVLQGKSDIMFYFTGLTEVKQLKTNQFRPGAIADHLTSFGGALTDSSQMSSLRWLEAGATGSYGTVVEPCNFPQKFPNPGIAMSHYLAGSTLLEAYWKSVAQPGQGIFIGEPLARPFLPRLE